MAKPKRIEQSYCFPAAMSSSVRRRPGSVCRFNCKSGDSANSRRKAEACQSVCATPAARPTHSGLALTCGHRVFVYSNLALSGAYAPGTMFPNSAIENLTGELLVLYGDMELYLQRQEMITTDQNNKLAITVATDLRAVMQGKVAIPGEASHVSKTVHGQ